MLCLDSDRVYLPVLSILRVTKSDLYIVFVCVISSCRPGVDRETVCEELIVPLCIIGDIGSHAYSRVLGFHKVLLTDDLWSDDMVRSDAIIRRLFCKETACGTSDVVM